MLLIGDVFPFWIQEDFAAGRAVDLVAVPWSRGDICRL